MVPTPLLDRKKVLFFSRRPLLHRLDRQKRCVAYDLACHRVDSLALKVAQQEGVVRGAVRIQNHSAFDRGHLSGGNSLDIGVEGLDVEGSLGMVQDQRLHLGEVEIPQIRGLDYVASGSLKQVDFPIYYSFVHFRPPCSAQVNQGFFEASSNHILQGEQNGLGPLVLRSLRIEEQSLGLYFTLRRLSLQVRKDFLHYWVVVLVNDSLQEKQRDFHLLYLPALLTHFCEGKL